MKEKARKALANLLDVAIGAMQRENAAEAGAALGAMGAIINTQDDETDRVVDALYDLQARVKSDTSLVRDQMAAAIMAALIQAPDDSWGFSIAASEDNDEITRHAVALTDALRAALVAP